MPRKLGIPNAQPKHGEMDKITFLLPAELKQDFEALCTKRGISMTAELIRFVESTNAVLEKQAGAE